MNLRNWSDLIPGILGLLFLVTLALGGGSSRDDMMQYVLPQIGAAVVLAALLLRDPDRTLREAGLPLAFLGLIVAALLAQLIPLSPSVWFMLPGREFYRPGLELASVAQAWRPTSLSPDRTSDALLFVLPVLATILLVANGSDRFRRNLFKALVVLATASAALAAFQLSDGPRSALRIYDVSNHDSGVGFFANRNHQALLLAMAIPAALWWSVSAAGRGRGVAIRFVIAAALIAMLLVGAILTGSRMGLALCTVAALSVFAVSWPHFPERLRKLRRGVVQLGIAAVAVAGFFVLSDSRLVTQPLSADSRATIWPRTIEAIQAYFPVGTGAGTFDRVYPRFEQIQDLQPEYVNRAHNEFLEVTLEFGLVGIALITLFLGWFAYAACRIWTRSADRREFVADIDAGRVASIVVALGLLASVTDYPLRTALMASIFAAACVILHRTAFGADREANSSGSSGHRHVLTD